jgi:hypothetical protein
MPQVGLRWHGLTELRAAMQTLPRDLTTTATPLVEEAADSAKADMEARYPRRTGRLASSLVIGRRQRGATTIAIRLTNIAPYAAYFEYGTRYTPPGRVFVPIRNAHQRALYAQLKADTLPAYNLRARGDVEI